MLLTPSQTKRFWREWSVACHVQGWDKAHSWTGAQIDAERKALLQRAGFTSLTQVDHTKGFDKVLAELALLSRPDSLAPQLRAQDQPRIRLTWKIKHSLQEYGLSTEYWQTIARDRWGTTDLDQLTLDQLEQLRNTLASRAAAEHTVAKSARDRAKRQASLAPRPSTLNRVHFGSKDLEPLHPNKDPRQPDQATEPEVETLEPVYCEDENPF